MHLNDTGVEFAQESGPGNPRLRVLQDATAAMERGNGEERRGCLLTSACGSEGEPCYSRGCVRLGVRDSGGDQVLMMLFGPTLLVLPQRL